MSFYALVIFSTHPAAKCITVGITVVFAAAGMFSRASTARAASNSHSDGKSQSFDSEAPSLGADAQAAFTGDLNTARAGSSDLLMSLKMPVRIRSASTMFGVIVGGKLLRTNSTRNSGGSCLNETLPLEARTQATRIMSSTSRFSGRV